MNVIQANISPIWNVDVLNYDGDIAVLELADEIHFNNFIRPICLANEESEVAQATKGIVVGFGMNENRTFREVATKLEVPIRKYHDCVSHSAYHHSMISYRTFCGGRTDGRGVCSGDSGGGVYVTHNDRFYLRGLVSSAIFNNVGECDVNRESVYTDVTMYYQWIDRFINPLKYRTPMLLSNPIANRYNIRNRNFYSRP